MNITRIILDANANGLKELSSSERLSTGLTVLALGMATVFVVLAILWVVLLLFRVVFYREKKPEPKKSAPAPAPAAAPEPTPAAVPAETEDNGALIAAITAAIAMYTEGDEAFASGFRVVSFRRAEHASPWNKSK